MLNHGFGNYFSSEAIEGVLPQHQNAPLHCSFELYAEQINGSAFTRARHQNLKTWIYRLLPSAVHHHRPFEISKHQFQKPLLEFQPPHPMRWSALPSPKKNQSFIKDTLHIASSGQTKSLYIYNLSESMNQECFVNHDAEMLFIPYIGQIEIITELGILHIEPFQIAVIPRGIGFAIHLKTPFAQGYLLENQGLPLKLPELGLMGANALANPRDFEYPKSHFEQHSQPHHLFVKSQGKIWEKTIKRSIFDVVAWHGNYAPYRYNLRHFNTLNTVSFDHPDPSIFTVLTSDSAIPGIASLDFVIFSSRWLVAEHTFRLPYFHRNVMSELMGHIHGQYDAKDEQFEKGGVSIHNQMTAHGPDFKSWQKEMKRSDESPQKIDHTLSFMLESSEVWHVTQAYFMHTSFQKNYGDCWNGFPIAETRSST